MYTAWHHEENAFLYCKELFANKEFYKKQNDLARTKAGMTLTKHQFGNSIRYSDKICALRRGLNANINGLYLWRNLSILLRIYVWYLFQCLVHLPLIAGTSLWNQFYTFSSPVTRFRNYKNLENLQLQMSTFNLQSIAFAETSQSVNHVTDTSFLKGKKRLLTTCPLCRQTDHLKVMH